MTLRSNDTLVDTSFQLISGFFHVNQGVLCSEHAEGGGSSRLPGLVTKQQAVEFPQVQTSSNYSVTADPLPSPPNILKKVKGWQHWTIIPLHMLPTLRILSFSNDT